MKRWFVARHMLPFLCETGGLSLGLDLACEMIDVIIEVRDVSAEVLVGVLQLLHLRLERFAGLYGGLAEFIELLCPGLEAISCRSHIV